MNHQRSAQCVEVQSQCQSQSFPSSPSVKGEMAVCTNELTLSTPLHMVTSGSSVPAEIDSDELNQMGLSSSGLHASQSDHKTGSALQCHLMMDITGENMGRNTLKEVSSHAAITNAHILTVK